MRERREIGGEESWFRPLVCLIWVKKQRKVGCQGLEYSLSLVFFFLMCVFHGCSIASCISMFPTLSLIHFINEEIVLVDDQLFIIIYFNYGLLDVSVI